jgi:hypothetical protein
MKKGLGIRPVPAQQHLPDAQVTEWILDSSGEYDGEGRPLPRKRTRFSGSRAKALAQRRSWLSQLAGDQPSSAEPGPQAIPDVATLAAALASVMTGAAVPATVTSLLASATKPRRTFADFVKKEYLDYSRRVHDETTTPDRMKMLERYVLPVVGALSLEEANAVDAVDKLRQSLDEIIAPRTRRKLMGNYKNSILLAFSHVLTVAKDRTLLPYKVTIGLYPTATLCRGKCS